MTQPSSWDSEKVTGIPPSLRPSSAQPRKDLCEATGVLKGAHILVEKDNECTCHGFKVRLHHLGLSIDLGLKGSYSEKPVTCTSQPMCGCLGLLF